MTESTRKRIVYVSSTVAVLWAGWTWFGEERPPVTHAPLPAEKVAVATPECLEKAFIDVNGYAGKAWGSDPFRTWPQAPQRGPVSKAAQEISWIVTGILHSPDNPMAFVNGRSARIGDTVDGAKIVAIDRKKVTLLFKGRRLQVAVKKG